MAVLPRDNARKRPASASRPWRSPRWRLPASSPFGLALNILLYMNSESHRALAGSGQVNNKLKSVRQNTECSSSFSAWQSDKTLTNMPSDQRRSQKVVTPEQQGLKILSVFHCIPSAAPWILTRHRQDSSQMFRRIHPKRHIAWRNGNALISFTFHSAGR